MTIWLVLDTFDETFRHNIVAAFLKEEDAKNYVSERNYKWHEIDDIEVTE